MKNKRMIILLATAAALLLAPLVAMQFTSEVIWKANDFIAMGILLFGAALSCEFALRKTQNTMYRVLICTAILLTLLLIWAELAVGIFGSPVAGS